MKTLTNLLKKIGYFTLLGLWFVVYKLAQLFAWVFEHAVFGLLWLKRKFTPVKAPKAAPAAVLQTNTNTTTNTQTK